MTQSVENRIPQKTTNFWVVCCEETAAAQQISKTIVEWQVPGLRSLVGVRELIEPDVKQVDYAIFTTESDRPCSQVQVSPFCQKQAPHLTQLLSAMQSSRGQAPQSWILKLPKEEMRANRLQPVDTQYAVDRALSTIEVFVRNYHLKPKTQQAAL